MIIQIHESLRIAGSPDGRCWQAEDRRLDNTKSGGIRWAARRFYATLGQAVAGEAHRDLRKATADTPEAIKDAVDRVTRRYAELFALDEELEAVLGRLRMKTPEDLKHDD